MNGGDVPPMHHGPPPLPALSSFTFLRLGPDLLKPWVQMHWLRFMFGMRP